MNAERYTGLTASSSNPSFPVSNLEGQARRSRVWQSSGHFTVTALNNVIRFRDALAGPTKSATIVPGEYASMTAFLAAVDTAMEAIGSANYTVIQNSQKKIEFSSDISGGATSFGLMGTDVLFTARDILGFNASDKFGGTVTADVVRIHTTETILLDLGGSFNPKMFCLFGPRNEPLRFQQTATVKLQANATDSWASPAFSKTLPWNEFGIYDYGKFGLHSSAMRYWRIEITDIDNPRGYVEISSIFLGDVIQMVKGCPQFPLEIQEVDLTASEQTLAGGSFASVYGKTAQLSLNWEFLTKTEMDSFRELFNEVGIGYWFAIMMDPNEVLSADQERYMLQVKFESEPRNVLARAGQWTADWSVVENV